MTRSGVARIPGGEPRAGLAAGLVLFAVMMMFLVGVFQAFNGLVAVFRAPVSAIATFGFIPYYPLWALIIIALDILVIWAIAAHGGEANLGR